MQNPATVRFKKERTKVELIPLQCLCKASATLPLSMGGLGLRSATRTRAPAHWSSWVDHLPVLFSRHPDVATRLVVHLERELEGLSLAAAADVARQMSRVPGFEFLLGAKC